MNKQSKTNTQSKLEDLKLELEGLRIQRKMNKCKIRETKARIRAAKLQDKTDKSKRLADKHLQHYYELARKQTHSAPIEKRVAVAIR